MSGLRAKASTFDHPKAPHATVIAERHFTAALEIVLPVEEALSTPLGPRTSSATRFEATMRAARATRAASRRPTPRTSTPRSSPWRTSSTRFPRRARPRARREALRRQRGRSRRPRRRHRRHPHRTTPPLPHPGDLPPRGRLRRAVRRRHPQAPMRREPRQQNLLAGHPVPRSPRRVRASHGRRGREARRRNVPLRAHRRRRSDADAIPRGTSARAPRACSRRRAPTRADDVADAAAIPLGFVDGTDDARDAAEALEAFFDWLGELTLGRSGEEDADGDARGVDVAGDGREGRVRGDAAVGGAADARARRCRARVLSTDRARWEGAVGGAHDVGFRG